MYTSGETEKAIHHFLGLLTGSKIVHSIQDTTVYGSKLLEDDGIDAVYLDDFRVAFQVSFHLTVKCFVLISFSISFLPMTNCRVDWVLIYLCRLCHRKEAKCG